MQKYLIVAWVLAALAAGTTSRAQDLVKDALASFPIETLRLEYTHPAKLRTLPNYTTLRQRYVGARLERLESSLAQLGIREKDVDELVLGWKPSAPDLEFYGLAAGRFNLKLVAQDAAARGLSPSPVGERQAYCPEAGLASTCVVLLSSSRGAFGPLAVLSALVDSGGGQATPLNSNIRFTKLLSDSRTSTPIWGVAVGPAIVDWFKGWIPGQENLKLDWSRTVANVEALAYNVDVADKIQLSVRFDCTSSEAALNLRQILEGLKLFQQLAWQNQNPNRPNPFQSLELDARGGQVNLKLATNYAALEAAGAAATP